MRLAGYAISATAMTMGNDTTEAMEVGPTCHYVMGGVEVDPETAAARVPGLYAAGEVAGGMHGSNRLGGNSLSDLLVFGKRAGAAAAEHAAATPPAPLSWQQWPPLRSGSRFRRGQGRGPARCAAPTRGLRAPD